MKIALLGYGRMGMEVEKVALERSHEVTLIVHSKDKSRIDNLEEADVVIDFTLPEVAKEHILSAFEANVPIVVGTTGWYEQLEELTRICHNKNGTLFYAPNFSIGVNMLFRLNEVLASMMNDHEAYEMFIEEIHHPQKKDAPSGTALKLAEGLNKVLERKREWWPLEKGENTELRPNQFPVYFAREEGEVGMHRVNYQSDIDELEIKHKAYSRRGFAIGAVKAAEWIIHKKGVYTMSDFLGLNA